MKNISILGSTGSIGTQTLDIVRTQGDVKVWALAAGSNIRLLEEQIREFLPPIACVFNEERAAELKTKVADLPVKICAGMEGLMEAATIQQAEIVVTAVVGMIGIRPTIAAIQAGKDIALANKETLVTAGHLIMPMAAVQGVSVYPVDSEHSAVFQALQGEDRKSVRRIILTASGGPFRGKKRSDLTHIQVEDALKHPNWEMGRKITIDSSTMVNKGLEVIEAKWLFDADYDQIQVVVHPESIIHSMVEFQDTSVIAQMGTPDMRLPIQYALYYPERNILNSKPLDFYKIGELHFEEPDLDTFRGLKLAYAAGRAGGTMPTVLNAANEYAVNLFLNRKISYLSIVDLIEEAMNAHTVCTEPALEKILEAEQATYEYLERRCKTTC